MCKTSNRATRMMIIQQQMDAEKARQEAAAAQAEQKKIQEQAIALQQQQFEFQKQQAEYVKQQDAKVEEIVSRPAPPPPPPPAVVITGGSAGMVADSGQAAVDSRKKGRQALRIDLNAPQTAGSTGLNVPIG